MTIEELLNQSREIWGDRRMTLEEIAVAAGVNMGDINRYVRDRTEDRAVDEAELKKEFGNMIFSFVRWCDDLGYDPMACIELAKTAQTKYNQR
jgi:hypothetical protein